MILIMIIIANGYRRYNGTTGSHDVHLSHKSPRILDCDIIRLKSYICLSIRGIRWD